MPRTKNKGFSLTEENKKRPMFKSIIPLLIFFLILALVFFAAKALISGCGSSGVFKLRQCYVEDDTLSLNGQQAFDYCQLSPGGNLLEVDLETLRDAILHTHPQLKEATVAKDYPDTIRICVKERKAFAQIEAKKFFLVDKEGFILEKSFEKPPLQLPLIIGVKSRHIKEGVFSRSPALKKAIGIIKLLESMNFKDKYGVKKIDVTNLNNISFYTKGDVEIKLGKDGFREKIKKVESRLPNLDLRQIRYIDLRFKDLIVGPK